MLVIVTKLPMIEEARWGIGVGKVIGGKIQKIISFWIHPGKNVSERVSDRGQDHGPDRFHCKVRKPDSTAE